jgi:hypothetical protein
VKRILEKIGYDGWLINEGSTPKGMERTESGLLNAAYTTKLFGGK